MSTPSPSVPAAQLPPLPEYVGYLHLGFLLIDACRYNLSRPSLPAQVFAGVLQETLPMIGADVRRALVQDIAQALRKDAVSQAARAGRPVSMISAMLNESQPLYSPADRQVWQQLLQAAAALGTAPDEFRAAAGS